MRARNALIALLFMTNSAGKAAESLCCLVPRQRVADAASDICLADCARRVTFCKQSCPATFGIPCQTSCDSENQTCRENCRPR